MVFLPLDISSEDGEYHGKGHFTFLLISPSIRPNLFFPGPSLNSKGNDTWFLFFGSGAHQMVLTPSLHSEVILAGSWNIWEAMDRTNPGQPLARQMPYLLCHGFSSHLDSWLVPLLLTFWSIFMIIYFGFKLTLSLYMVIDLKDHASAIW